MIRLKINPIAKEANDWRRIARTAKIALCLSMLIFHTFANDLIVPAENEHEKESVADAAHVVQQTRTITGVVRDASGPVIGANVIVKGTTNGAVTNVEGQFTISNVPSNAVLQVSFIGYISQEVNVGNRTQYDITLQEDIETLEEIVVVGYGTLQRRDVTGSVAQVQSETIQNLGSARIDQALTGLIAGVQVITNTGQPGEELRIRVRGVGSISAGTSPLYVVDGFPQSDIRMLSPDDIETIDILKDASATAIYGSRGANGVVLITTKRGKEGRSTISLNVYYGWQQVLKQQEFLTMQEQAQYYYDGIVNENLDAGNDMSGAPNTWRSPVPQTIMRVLDGSISKATDPYEAIFRTAPQQSYNLSAQGGTDKIRYSISGSYLSQEGIIITSNFDRFSVRSNIDAQVHDRVSMKFNINSSYTISTNIQASGGSQGSEGILGAATTWLYWYPFYNEDGTYLNAYAQDAINAVWNPIAQANEIRRRNERSNTSGNWITDIKIMEGLQFNFMIGATTSATHNYYFIPQIEAFPNTAEGEDSRRMSLNWITESTLNYQKKFNQHSINALLGYTTQKDANNSNSIISRNYPNNLVHTLNAVSNVIYQGNSRESQWSLVSYLARINYNYNSKYYITASIRADGSSRFGRDNKYGYFPSTALMWRMSEEGFMKDANLFNDLKLRASYGATGNNDIGNYAHLATVAYTSYIMGGGPNGGMAPNNIENSLLTWEKQNSINFGLDASVLNNRINLTFDYFITKNHQLLLEVKVPQLTGFDNSLQNIGEVENKGWEITMNTHNLKGVFDWRTNFNISAFRNKVLKLGPEGAPIINTMNITMVGEPMGMFYGYQQDGIFKTQAELDAGPIWGPGTSDRSRIGDIRFKDMNGDGVITVDDKTIIGNPYPKFYYGMTNTFAYKNFSLSFAFTGSYGNKVFDSNDNQLYTRARYKQDAIVNDYWKSEAQPGNGNEPRPNNAPKGGLREKSTRFMQPGSYLRVNNINLGYSVPRRIAQNLYLSSLRVYVSSTNPFLFTEFRSFNPEVSNSSNPLTPGLMNYNYPIAKSFLFGFNVTF